MSVIGESAFSGTALKSVIIHAGVTDIGESAFSGCATLTEVVVDSTNPYYSSVDGVLFSKDQTVLIAYPGAKAAAQYTVPETVSIIADYAFSGSALERITIPVSVTAIGEGAFEDCTALVSVAYDGNEEAWSAIAIGDGNTILLDKLVIATAQPGDVNEDGIVNLGDVQLLFMFTRNKAELTAEGLAASDVNNDGTVNLGDVQLLFMFTRGKATLG